MIFQMNYIKDMIQSMVANARLCICLYSGVGVIVARVIYGGWIEHVPFWKRHVQSIAYSILLGVSIGIFGFFCYVNFMLDISHVANKAIDSIPNYIVPIVVTSSMVILLVLNYCCYLKDKGSKIPQVLYISFFHLFVTAFQVAMFSDWPEETFFGAVACSIFIYCASFLLYHASFNPGYDPFKEEVKINVK
jgi:hypothetical protein